MNYLRESIYFSSLTEGNVYGSLETDNSANVVSDYVHNLANGIYKEFETLILHYGESVVKNLMPMVVSCLETLDRVYSEKHNIEVEFELLKEDSSQLMAQYEREKSHRKNAEENLFKCEDNYSEISKKYEEDIQNLKSLQKMHEIRLKNSQDQVLRLEKRDNERHLEYEKLLLRYHDLLKSKNYHLEATKLEEIKSNFNSSKTKYNSNEIKKNINFKTSNNQINLCSELDLEYKKNTQISPEWDLSSSRSDEDNYTSDNEISTGTNTLPFDDELAGMSHEIENIIKENNDLIATKNALNIVKDDLISRLDEANSEIEILQHETNSLNTVKTSLKIRISNLEIENKGLKQEITLLQNKTEEDKDEENIPMSQRKRFTRLEMARVLMERNQMKEKLLELEEYVKWIKVLKNKEKKLSIWERFSRLFKSNSHNVLEKSKTEIKSKSILNEGNRDLISECFALKDPNRQQINGWSLPRLTQNLTFDLPMPIYCRPLLENQSGLEITCAVSVNFSRGLNLKNNTYVGSSIFYGKNILYPDFSKTEGNIKQENINKSETLFNTNFDNNGSHVWICTSSDNQSQIIIVDANKPADYLDAFIIQNSPVQCMGSVPGANQNDYIQKCAENSLEFQLLEFDDINLEQSNGTFLKYKMSLIDCLPFNVQASDNIDELTDLTITTKFPHYSNIHETYNSEKSVNFDQSSAESTIWIGCRNGDLFVHPAIGNRSLCLNHVRLPDSITFIIYQNSKVFVSLANGSLAVFNRYISSENKNNTGQWQMSKYHYFEPENFNYSIRCLEGVTLTNKIWIGYRNKIVVMDDTSLSITKCFEAHPRSDYTIRQMCWAGDGVWVSLRLDTTLKLFHIHNYLHLQDLNVEPHINKLIEPSLLGLSLLRITCLSTSCNRIWIGTNKGIIISAPFLNGVKQSSDIEITTDLPETLMNSLYLPTFIPNINHEDLQLSYHGHRDAVKFFVTVRCKLYENLPPDSDSNQKLDIQQSKPRFLIMSGGEGYKDFRLNENVSVNTKYIYPKANIHPGEITKNDSHLIVWQLSKNEF